jgi:hypothetical protein
LGDRHLMLLTLNVAIFIARDRPSGELM